MSYTNQKTFRSLQVTLDLLTSTRDQIYIQRYVTIPVRDTGDNAIPVYKVTPAKHTPKQYHSNTQ